MSAFANSSKTIYAIETDPSTFAFDGYAFHARISPERLPHWRFGAGIYSMEFPDAFIDLNSKNRNDGWKVNLDQGIGLFTEYYFHKEQIGWFIGVQAAQQQFVIKNDETGNISQQFDNALIMPYTGYKWNLYKGFYAMGWAGIGYTTKISGDTKLGSKNYDINPIIPFATIHIGYEF